MKSLKIAIALFLSVLLFSCEKQTPVKQPSSFKKVEEVQPSVDSKELQSDFRKWWTYYSYEINLSTDFIGLNEQLDIIEKSVFLKLLTSGKYIPLKEPSSDEIHTYRLLKLSSDADESISATIKNEAKKHWKHFQMEGTPLPAFDVTDLNGNRYTNASTKGKTLVLKTWFINCKACVAEFPELNEWVGEHQQQKDLIFLSFALDQSQDLERFLQKREFAYQTVPNQKEFINTKMNLSIYPTHLIVDKNGIIQKVVNNASDIISFFEKQERLKGKKAAPPPPAAI